MKIYIKKRQKIKNIPFYLFQKFFSEVFVFNFLQFFKFLFSIIVGFCDIAPYMPASSPGKPTRCVTHFIISEVRASALDPIARRESFLRPLVCVTEQYAHFLKKR